MLQLQQQREILMKQKQLDKTRNKSSLKMAHKPSQVNPKPNFAKSITNSNAKAKAGNPVAKAQPGAYSHNRNQQMLHGVKLPAAGQSQKNLALKAAKVDQLGLSNTISFGVNKKSTQHLKGASFAGNQL